MQETGLTQEIWKLYFVFRSRVTIAVCLYYVLYNTYGRDSQSFPAQTDEIVLWFITLFLRILHNWGYRIGRHELIPIT